MEGKGAYFWIQGDKLWLTLQQSDKLRLSS